MDLSNLMHSTVTTYLLLIDCEDSQLFGEETKSVIWTFFDKNKTETK
jgi:hypothetical protein